MTDEKKLSIWDVYESDANLEETGVWVETLPEGTRFKIASMDNKKASEYIQELYEPHKMKIREAQQLVERGEKAPASVTKLIQDIELQVFCRYVLLDWENVTNRDGTKLKYTWQNALKLLKDKNMRRLKERLFEEADRQSNFAIKMVKESEKNLPKISTGS